MLKDIEKHRPRASAFGGGNLAGSRMTRNIYADESGVGNISQDPFLVIAAVIVHADDQWQALADYLRLMAEDCFPRGSKIPEGFYFHAKDLFHGAKYFHRDRWSKTTRFEILDELVGIPAKFGLPVAFGSTNRLHIVEKYPDWPDNARLEFSYLRSAMVMLCQAQSFMAKTADEGEVANIVFENTPKLPKQLKRLHYQLRDPESEIVASGAMAEFLPLDRLIDTPHFVEKHESSLLQIADACAFAIKRKEQRGNHWDRFYEPVQQQCVMLRKDELDTASRPNMDRIRYKVQREE